MKKKKLVIYSDFSIGDIVYLKTDFDQHKRIVVRLFVSSLGVVYETMLGGTPTYHYDFELSLEKIF